MIFAIFAALLALAWILAGLYCKRMSPFRREYTWIYAFFRPFCAAVCLFLYRRKTVGARNVPAEGGCLVIANHASYADVVCLALACPRPVRYVSWAGFEDNPVSRLFMRALRTIPIAPDKAKDGVKAAIAALRAGELVCVFPEGCMTRNGSLQAFLGGFELIARSAGVPVVPAGIDGLWGSIFSFRGKTFFGKFPRISRTPVAIEFGKPFRMGRRAGEKSLQDARFAVLELCEKLFSERRELRGHLAGTLIDACARAPFRTAVADHSLSRRKMPRGLLLALSRCLARKFSSEIRERRVGIVLPPGIAGMAANYACALAGKTPVNLNFTLGRAQLESCLKKAEVETVVTVGAMKKQLAERFPEFPWPEKQLDILDEIRAIPRARLLLAFAQTVLLPAAALKKLWGVPAEGGSAEAGILFTSGSSGMPKAAVVSHRNIIANCMQIDDYDILPPKTRLLCNLPIFHCFGYTTLLWFAATRDILAVTTPSPLDFARNLQAIREEKVNVLLSTPTFLRSYIKKAPPEYLDSVRLVVAGAEKTPEGFAAAWEKKFPQTRYLEGYGMTEASPVVSVNKPDVEDAKNGVVCRGNAPGTVGILFPGMNAKVCDPDSGEILRCGESGMLFLKGANIFEGYLGDAGALVPATDADGWYKTGDIVSMDERGFISIKGRLSRFSKIGGEMVPHGTVEDAVRKILGVGDEEETLKIAVAGRPDEAKGEALVLVTTLAGTDLAAVARGLSEAGFPNLWIPRELKIVPEIPTLGTGKLDIRALAELAKTR